MPCYYYYYFNIYIELLSSCKAVSESKPLDGDQTTHILNICFKSVLIE